MGTRIASISGLRGIVGDGLDPADVVRFAAAYAAECSATGDTILVGHDGRRSAPTLVQAVLSGLTASGRHVRMLGPVATPTLGVNVASGSAAGGVQISASHNPPEYNGLKFFQPGGMVLDPDRGKAMLGRFERGEFDWAAWDRLGRVTLGDPLDSVADHLSRIEGLVDRRAIRSRRFPVVLDACHGAGGLLGGLVLRDLLGCDARILGGEPDGRYDHTPEPTEANLKELAAIVPAVGAAVGFAQDPDADRLAIIDETGRYIGEELTLALAVRHRLSQRTGPIVLNLSTSRTAEDIATQYGCPTHRSPVGEINVVEAMREHGAIIGGEGNGGVIDPRIGWVRDSFVGMAIVLDLMAQTGEPLSALVDELPRHVMVKTKFPVGPEPIGTILDRIAEAYPEATADRRDGLRLDWSDGWAHVRASNTEPIVRVITEARDERRARALAEDLGRRTIGEVGSP